MICIFCKKRPIIHPKSKTCHTCWCKEWKRKNPEKAKLIEKRANNTPKRKLYRRLWARKKARNTFEEDKTSDTYIGTYFENIACCILKGAYRVDIDFEKKHPYDLIWNNKKIDVKSSVIHIQKRKAGVYKFHLRRKDQTDYFFLICRKDFFPIKTYLIPSNEVFSNDIGIGQNKSKFDKYLFH